MTFITPMNDAVAGNPASSADYNILRDNVLDLDTRVTSNTSTITHVTSGNSALDTRVTALETGGVVGLKRAVYPSQTTNLTGAASAETDIAKLAMTSLSVTSGVLYRFNLYLNVSSSVAGDAFGIRLRRTTALTGPQLAEAQVNTRGSHSPLTPISFYWIANLSGSLNFYFSFVRLAGSGTMTIYQDATYKNFAEAFHVGVPGGGIIQTPA